MIRYILFFTCIGFFSPALFASELLLKSGEAFLIEEINESADVVNIRWKGRQYRIPKSEIQRIDYNKKGPESSYNYSEFRLTDGSSIRGIIVETKKDKLVFRTELGFVEIETSKIQNSNETSLEIQNESPDLPDKYLSGRSGENLLYVGGGLLLQTNVGPSHKNNPGSGGAGVFIEKGFLSRPLWFLVFFPNIQWLRAHKVPFPFGISPFMSGNNSALPLPTFCSEAALLPFNGKTILVLPTAPIRSC